MEALWLAAAAAARAKAKAKAEAEAEAVDGDIAAALHNATVALEANNSSSNGTIAARRLLSLSTASRHYVTARSGWGEGRLGWDPGSGWMAAYKQAHMPANPKLAGNAPTAASLPLRRCWHCQVASR